MLFALQRTVLAALGQLDASDSFALAGGAALIVHGVADLLGRFPKERLVELAVAKDAGFTLDRFAESLAALHRFSDADWEAHGAERERFTRMFDEWRAAITA